MLHQPGQKGRYTPRQRKEPVKTDNGDLTVKREKTNLSEWEHKKWLSDRLQPGEELGGRIKDSQTLGNTLVSSHSMVGGKKKVKREEEGDDKYIFQTTVSANSMWGEGV